MKNVKIEFKDASNRTAIVICTNVGSTVKYYGIDTARINTRADITRISSISFVVDSNLVAQTSPAGKLHIVSGGLSLSPLPYVIMPQATGTLTVLPPKPLKVISVGGANPGTRVDQYSSSRFRVFYDVTTGWSGASILYDDYGSAPFEVGDFSKLTSVVFAVEGRLNSMKIEFEDSSSNKVVGDLLNVSETRQYYEVNVGTLSNKGLNVQSVKLISFVVDSSHVGAANLSGYFDVFTAGLTNNVNIYPQTDLWLENNGLTPTDWPYGDTDGDGVDNITEYYAGTSPVDSNSAPLLDIAMNGKTNALLSIDGFVGHEYRFYRTGNLRTGTWVRVGGPFLSNADAPVLYSEGVTFLTNLFYRCSFMFDEVTRIRTNDSPTRVGIVGGSSPGATTINKISSNEFKVTYFLLPGEWAGASLLYDDYGTTNIVEYQDLHLLSKLTFAISGMPQTVNFEFEDVALNKVVGTFQYVTNAWNTYMIDTGLLTAKGLDLTHVRSINFVVDQWSIGLDPFPAFVEGSFSVRSWNLDIPFPVGISRW